METNIRISNDEYKVAIVRPYTFIPFKVTKIRFQIAFLPKNNKSPFSKFVKSKFLSTTSPACTCCDASRFSFIPTILKTEFGFMSLV